HSRAGHWFLRTKWPVFDTTLADFAQFLPHPGPDSRSRRVGTTTQMGPSAPPGSDCQPDQMPHWISGGVLRGCEKGPGRQVRKGETVDALGTVSPLSSLGLSPAHSGTPFWQAKAHGSLALLMPLHRLAIPGTGGKGTGGVAG